LENSKVEKPLECIDVDRRIILKHILKELGLRDVKRIHYALVSGSVMDTCEYSNNRSYPLKGEKLLE
jgi:hypothetical protein